MIFLNKFRGLKREKLDEKKTLNQCDSLIGFPNATVPELKMTMAINNPYSTSSIPSLPIALKKSNKASNFLAAIPRNKKASHEFLTTKN